MPTDPLPISAGRSCWRGFAGQPSHIGVAESATGRLKTVRGALFLGGFARGWLNVYLSELYHGPNIDHPMIAHNPHRPPKCCRSISSNFPHQNYSNSFSSSEPLQRQMQEATLPDA